MLSLPLRICPSASARSSLRYLESESLLHWSRRTVNLRRLERARKEGSTGRGLEMKDLWDLKDLTPHAKL